MELEATNQVNTVAIQAHELCLRYPDGTIGSDGISVEIRRGELFALLGPNGAGKTTLVRQLSVDLRPQSGAIHVFGVNAWENPSTVKRHFGIIPQHAGLFGGLTVEEHVRCFASLKGIPRAYVQQETERVIDECRLRDIRRKNVKRISGGQQRRVLVALALLGSPPILILDEPTTGLDPVARRALWETIRQERDAGKTIILTSHYLDEVEALADRVAFINAGRLLRSGTQAELVRTLPYQVRVTNYGSSAPPIERERLFRTLREAQQYVQERKLADYAVTRVGLDDLYFHLVGERYDTALGA